MKRIERIIFYLLLFSIPFETRIILGQSGRHFNEWTSIFLYGADILIGALFLLWLFRRDKFSWRRSDGILAAFFAVSVISLFQAKNFDLGIYQLIKLAEFIGLYWYIRANFKNINIRESCATLAASGFFQAIISILQYWKQSSLGLKYLGETLLGPDMSGVAVVAASGEKFLRSYGTTLHPNILAAFLFLAIYAFYFLYFYRSGIGIGIKLTLFYIPFVFGFLFTFSRVVIGLWLAGAAIRSALVFLRVKFRPLLIKTIFRLVFLTVITLTILGAFAFLFYPQVVSRLKLSSNDQAVNLRIWYAKESVKIISDNFWGVGAGNFVSNLMKTQKELPRWQYQPVHNIYLLIGAEAGILGLGLFLLFLFLLAKEYIRETKFEKLYHYSFFLIFVSFLIMGFFDHFLWTSQPGGLMFWLTLALLGTNADGRDRLAGL